MVLFHNQYGIVWMKTVWILISWQPADLNLHCYLFIYSSKWLKDQCYRLLHWCILCRTYFENQFNDRAKIFRTSLTPYCQVKQRKANGRKCYKQGFFVILKRGLNVLESHFLCGIHGPQNCMKWMKSDFRCWNLCFHMILWCFNPSDTIHFFLWDWITSSGCGVMARLSIQTTGFGFCLWQCLNDSSAHLSNTQRHRITIENPFLDGQVHILFSENKSMSKLHCQRWNSLLPSILKLF